MTEKLDQLIEEIKAARKRWEDLETELSDSKARLEETRRAQAGAIVNDKSAEKFGRDIVTLETKLKGIEAARLQLAAIIRELEARRASEERAIGIGQAELAKGEYLALEAEMYSRLVDAAMCVPRLRQKRVEYIAALKKSGAGRDSIQNETRKIAFLVEQLTDEIPILLTAFPRSILVDGKLPMVEEIKKLLK